MVAVLTDALPGLAVQGLTHVTWGLHGGAGLMADRCLIAQRGSSGSPGTARRLCGFQ